MLEEQEKNKEKGVLMSNKTYRKKIHNFLNIWSK